MEKGTQSFGKFHSRYEFAEHSWSSRKRVSTDDCYLPSAGTVLYFSLFVLVHPLESIVMCSCLGAKGSYWRHLQPY